MGALLTSNNTSPSCTLTSPTKQCQLHEPPVNPPMVCCQLNPCHLSTQEMAVYYKAPGASLPTSKSFFSPTNPSPMGECPQVRIIEECGTNAPVQESQEQALENRLNLKHLRISCSSSRCLTSTGKKSFQPLQTSHNSKSQSLHPQISTISDGHLSSTAPTCTTFANTSKLTNFRKNLQTFSGIQILSPTSLSSANISECKFTSEQSKAAHSVLKCCNAESLSVDNDVRKSSSCYSLKLENMLAPDKQEAAENMLWSTYAANRGHQRSATVLQGSTSELMKCLAKFYERRCPRVRLSSASTVITWLRTVDRTLILQGWADVPFISPGNLIFLFMLLRDCIHEEITSEPDLKSITLICLYIAYAYMGNEISYPVKPFLLREEDRHLFWQRCLAIMNAKSSDMLRVNADAKFFTNLFIELKGYGKR